MLLDYAPENGFSQAMKIHAHSLMSALVVSAALVTSCKPKPVEKAPEPAPVVSNAPPVTAPVVTNAPVATNPPPVIKPSEAKTHIGDRVTVRGQVYDVHISQKGDVFLNFGGKFPNSVFSAVCFQGAIPAAELTALKGRTVSITGTVKDYNGQVEIVLESTDQITK